MKFLKVVASNESPNIKDVLWLKPVDNGFTLFYPENGWKPLKMENVSESNYEQAGAADSVKKEGISLDIYTYNSGTTEADIMEILGKPEIAQLDILFGPVDEQQLPATTQFCKEHNIKLVLPFVNEQSTIGNSHLYIACPTNDVNIREAASMITNTYSDKNFIILKRLKA